MAAQYNTQVKHNNSSKNLQHNEAKHTKVEQNEKPSLKIHNTHTHTHTHTHKNKVKAIASVKPRASFVVEMKTP